MKIDKNEVLSLLRKSDGYISGQELCDKFQVSRTAVWKVINQLKEEGYELEAVQNRGYRLLQSPNVLSQKELTSRMNTKWLAQSLYYYDTIGSTNIEAKRLAEEGAPHGTLVVADAQTAGRGRRGRSWVSPAGSSVYFTVLLKPQFQPEKASMLTLVIAHSVALAVERYTGMDVGIKWPNDLVIDGQKICGILTEMNVETDYIQHVVIGVGININQQTKEEFAEEIRENAISIRMAYGKEINRAELTAYIMEQFEKDYEIFVKTENLSGLLESYSTHLVNLDKQVKVLDPHGEYTGIARGIEENGELIVEKEDHTIEHVYAGEVSVRGIYGYT